MPFYTYTCPDCHLSDTLMRKVAERDFPVECDRHIVWDGEVITGAYRACPDLHLMTRDIAGPAFALKGKGWARDGYGG